MLMIEVKGSNNEKKSSNYEEKVSNKVGKKLNKMRSHAMAQLKDHKDIIGYKHNISESALDKIRSCIFWPNLSSLEDGPDEVCSHCPTPHERFKPKPKSCPSRRKNGEKDPIIGDHVFEEDLLAFNRWLLDFLDSEVNLMTEADWTDCLNIFLLLSVGCLFDEMDKSFILQSMTQHTLTMMPEHEMSTPRFIYGPAGSGKTLSVIAKIESLYKTDKINNENKVLFVCKNRELHCYIKYELEKRNIQISNIDFLCFEDLHDFPDTSMMFRPLITDYSAIFVDEAEDLGAEDNSGLDNILSGLKPILKKKGKRIKKRRKSKRKARVAEKDTSGFCLTISRDQPVTPVTVHSKEILLQYTSTKYTEIQEASQSF